LVLEVILNQELGEPFRRDAMKKPVKVAVSIKQI
jgi:sulfoacetaldehyde acetyltransferase